MKKLIVLTVLLLNIFACSQTNENPKPMNQDKITIENYKEKMLSEIKHYPQEPMYYIYVHNNLCLYEMLVNDYPIEKRFEYSTSGTPFYINTAILKSGKQKLTFRMYPAPKEYNEGSDVLDQYASLEFKIYVNNNATGLKMANEKKVLEGAAKQINYEDSSQKYFEGKGKKYYEFTVEFDAQVPYSLESWTAGEDLRKFDQKKLEEKALSIYDYYRDNVSGDKITNIVGIHYTKNIRDMITEYETRDKVNSIYNSLIKISETKKEWQNFGHKIVFNGDGRILTLEQSNDSDDRLRGRSALFYLYNDEDNVKMSYDIYLPLYIPKGGTIDDLQVLR